MNSRTILGVLVLSSAACGTSSISPTSPTPPVVPTPSRVTKPSISSISPASAAAGTGDVAITISGSAFQDGTFALWWVPGVETDLQTDLQTRYVSNTELIAIIPAALLKDPAPAQISVINGDVMGWWDGYRAYPNSNALRFDVVGGSTMIAGQWVGTFDAGDPADCHNNTPASATFEQKGEKVHGILRAGDACELSGVIFDGGFEAGELKGTLTSVGFSGSMVGTLSGDALELRIRNVRDWDAQMAAGLMHLHRLE